jgi:hypothetical protein
MRMRRSEIKFHLLDTLWEEPRRGYAGGTGVARCDYEYSPYWILYLSQIGRSIYENIKIWQRFYSIRFVFQRCFDRGVPEWQLAKSIILAIDWSGLSCFR